MIPAMGRPKTIFLDLPPRMTARVGAKGKILYYYGQQKLALGSDLNKARLKWVELENGGVPTGVRYVDVAERWENEAIHLGRRRKTRSLKTQGEFRRCLKELRLAFKPMLLEQIRPKHVSEYLDRRTRKVSANREVAVLSIIWNWARSKGLTDKANPCEGIDRNPESPRERYVETEEFNEVWEKACPELQDAMDLAYLTGQRPSDILRMTRQDIKDGALWVRQGKTGKRLGLRVEGRLKEVLERILARSRPVQTMFLIAGDDGQKLSIYGLNYRFRKAKGNADWQFRDLRAKMVSDEEDLKAASKRAGHADERITKKVYHRLKGEVVSPLK